MISAVRSFLRVAEAASTPAALAPMIKTRLAIKHSPIYLPADWALCHSTAASKVMRLARSACKLEGFTTRSQPLMYGSSLRVSGLDWTSSLTSWMVPLKAATRSETALTDSKVHSTQDLALWSKSEHAAGNLLEPLFKLVWTNSKEVKC